MRRITRNAVVLLAVVVLALLALGALPSLLQSGDPYYLTADPVNASVVNETLTAGDPGTGGASTGENGTDDTTASTATSATATTNASVVNGTALSDRRYPYTTEALSNGSAGPYYEGPWGLKEAFTHSPFDELSALEARNPPAVTDQSALVRYNGTVFRVAVGRRP
jgi:hypothetical protein